LTLANRERGKEALGFFNSTGEIFKRATDPIDLLADSECTEYLDRSERDSWFVVGHTRYSTRGANIDKNSHPFQYGNIIGSHNGIIDAPHTYTVDSEYLIDQLDIHDSNYQSALSNDWGYWTTSWYDTKKDELFLSMHDNTCGLVKHRGAWYFSSDPDHLASSLGVRDTIVMKSGDTVSFDNSGQMKWRKKFESTITYSYKRDKRTGGGSNTAVSHKTYGRDYTVYKAPSANSSYGGINDPDGVTVDYDNEFKTMWQEYSSQHSGD
jgi:hypothetical protein